MTPEIRRGDIGTGRHGENRLQRRRYCGVINQRHRQRRFISWRIILTNGKLAVPSAPVTPSIVFPLSANVTAAPDEGCTVKSSSIHIAIQRRPAITRRSVTTFEDKRNIRHWFPDTAFTVTTTGTASYFSPSPPAYCYPVPSMST